MFAIRFDFQRDPLNLRSITARDVQAYYDKHADAAAKVGKLKWLGVALLGLVCLAAIASDESRAAGTNVQLDAASVSPVTIFIDGPTGFVFVYTAEGWKFVRANVPVK